MPENKTAATVSPEAATVAVWIRLTVHLDWDERDACVKRREHDKVYGEMAVAQGCDKLLVEPDDPHEYRISFRPRVDLKIYRTRAAAEADHDRVGGLLIETNVGSLRRMASRDLQDCNDIGDCDTHAMLVTNRADPILPSPPSPQHAEFIDISALGLNYEVVVESDGYRHLKFDQESADWLALLEQEVKLAPEWDGAD